MAQRLSSVERKSQIITATLDIVSEKGFGNITTAEIANRVGISEGAVFKHFSTKAEILQEVLMFIRNTLLPFTQNIAKQAISPEEKLREILNYKFAFFSQYPGVPKMIFSEQVHLADGQLKVILFGTVRGFNQIINDIIAEGVKKDLFKKNTDLDLATEAFLGLIQVNVFKWSLCNHTWSLTERADKIVNYFIKTLKV